jgi:hypothetical protein
LQIELDRHGVRVDGRRGLIRAGELPYYRLPAPDLWRDRLQKMRDAGLDAVSISYPWSFHSPRRGDHDFSGERDVDQLHDLIQEAGLWLIARPGPYLGLDLDLGGLPAWLLREPEMRLRSRDEHGYAHSPAFIDAVSEWFEQIVPRFAGRDNLLWVQVENGYVATDPLARIPADLADVLVRWLGTPRLARWLRRGPLPDLLRSWVAPRDPEGTRGQSSGYMRELVKRVRELGVEVPVAHGDAFVNAGRQADVDLPALDFYPLRFPDPGSSERAAALEAPLRHAAAAAGFRSDLPLVYAELQAGIADQWGGYGYDAIRAQLGPAFADGLTKMALAAGATAWSWRPFCGGTTPGFLSAPETYGSYDAAAPIPESGATEATYEALRALVYFLEPFQADLAASEVVQGRGTWCPEHVCTRAGAEHRYAFLCNSSPVPIGVPTPEAERARLAPWEAQIRVYDAGGKLEAVSPLPPTAEPRDPGLPPSLPRLTRWDFQCVSPQLDPAYDDSTWKEIDPLDVELGKIDIDTLGVHHGFIWYRATFNGSLDRLILDARHCWSVWLNGRLVSQGEALRNLHGIGPDGARRRRIPVNGLRFNEGRNALVILVESLGHSQHLAPTTPAPRGLVRIDLGETRARWRYRGGLLRGEQGIAPVVVLASCERTGASEILLPYGWTDEPEGVALFETRFELSGVDPARHALALAFDPGIGKASLFLNGHLIGRYWPERGPQRRFLLPWGLLQPDAENELGVALWKRGPRASLGKLRLELA